MRGLSNLALLVAPVAAVALTAVSGDTATKTIHLNGIPNVDFLSLRFTVHESTKPCGDASVTIGGKELSNKGHGDLSLVNGISAVARWKTVCTGEEQYLMMAIDAIPGRTLEGVEFVVRFRQTAPVEVLDVAGAGRFEEDEDVEEESWVGITREQLELDLAEDFMELGVMRSVVGELEDMINFKEGVLDAISRLEEPNGITVHAHEECRGVLCFFKGLLDRIIGLGHPAPGRWPHKGQCGNHTGNHTHGNHTFPHPPWWRHPHGNHTHGNHTFPHPPWWRHPHGNHTHGNHTFPHPPWRRPHHRPPFFCHPHRHPGKSLHGRPPHGKPPHERPPHGPPHDGPPHFRPPHDGPPRDGTPRFRPPFGRPSEQQESSQRQISSSEVGFTDAEQEEMVRFRSPLELYRDAQPVVQLGILVTLIGALIVTLHARCCARRDRMAWEERRQARREFVRARRSTMRRRWIAFLDALRPEDEYGCREEEGRAEKAAMLAGFDEEPTGEKSKVFEDLTEVVVDEKRDEAEEQEEGVTSMSMSQELASFQDAARMVSEMVDRV